jgi:hypothetical protein
MKVGRKRKGPREQDSAVLCEKVFSNAEIADHLASLAQLLSIQK